MSALLKMMRVLYLERSTGTLIAKGKVFAHFLEGEVYLPQEHSKAAEAASGTASPELIKTLASQWRKDFEESRFDGGTARLEGEPAGPLPTLDLLMSLATHGLGHESVLESLGGLQARYRCRGETPALKQLRGLDACQSQVLPRLESATTIKDLTRLTCLNTADVVAALANLWAVGLADCLDSQAVESPSAEVNEALSPVTPRLLETFSDRIAEMLERPESLDLEPAEHRDYISELFENQQEYDHFRFLGLSLQQSDAGVAEAFSKVACRVHPLHAKELAMDDRADVFRTLFERAIEAYLVLSDPHRRVRYLERKGIGYQSQTAVNDNQRQRETQDLAAQFFRESQHYLSPESMDYMSAVNILSEAVRLDPRPAYYARLADAQSYNPQWRDRAVANYRQAIEGDPEDPELHISLARMLQTTGDNNGARMAYLAALELAPNHAVASSGLENLSMAGSAAAFGRSLRSILTGE